MHHFKTRTILSLHDELSIFLLCDSTLITSVRNMHTLLKEPWSNNKCGSRHGNVTALQPSRSLIEIPVGCISPSEGSLSLCLLLHWLVEGCVWKVKTFKRHNLRFFSQLHPGTQRPLNPFSLFASAGRGISHSRGRDELFRPTRWALVCRLD